MNERIKEMIKSLGIIPESEHFEIAELIIRDCVNVASVSQFNKPDVPVYIAIEEHFDIDAHGVF